MKVLNLGYNKISDITILKEMNFKDLRKFYLNDNVITDISLLNRVNFEKLKSLNKWYKYNWYKSIRESVI